MPRDAAKRSDEQRMKDTIRKRLQRSRDPDAIREKERLYKANRRADPMIRAQERRNDKVRKALKRSDPLYREAERQRNTMQRRLKRMDLDYRAGEQARSKIMRDIKRENPDFACELELCEIVQEEMLSSDSSNYSKSIRQTKMHIKRENPDYHSSLELCDIVKQEMLNSDSNNSSNSIRPSTRSATRKKLEDEAQSTNPHEELSFNESLFNLYSIDNMN